MAVTGSSTVQALRVGPGVLMWAPLGSTAPTDLTTAWDAAWSGIGYTEEGHELVYTPTFEERRVAEEDLAIGDFLTQSTLNLRFAMAQISPLRLSLAFNGGTIDGTLETDTVTKWEPPGTGVFVPRMLGWQSTDGLERAVVYKVTQVGAVTIPRRRAPAAANIPVDMKAGQPDAGVSLVPWTYFAANTLAEAAEAA